MEIIEILHPLGKVQCNTVSEWKDSGPCKVALNCSVHPGGVVNIILFPSDDLFGSDCRQYLAIVKTKNGLTVAVSRAVFDAADKTAVKQPHDIKQPHDTKYTGGAQPTPPAQQAAEKPREAPAAIPPGVIPVTAEPSGAYKNQPMWLEATICVPKLDADGGFVRDTFTKQAKWEVRVTGAAIPKGVTCKVFGEADKAKPPLQPGKQLLYVSREDNKNKPGQYWYEVSAKPSEGKGGGGGFRQDVELAIVCAVASNPTIERKDWLEASKKLREDYYTLKGGSK